MAESETLMDLKTLIGLEGDSSQDALLKLIIKNTTAQLRTKLHLGPGKPIPEELGYILTEVAVRRYNRRSNEGMASYGQEGETITFNADDFADFAADIAGWLDDNKPEEAATLGRVRFLNPYGGRRR